MDRVRQREMEIKRKVDRQRDRQIQSKIDMQKDREIERETEMYMRRGYIEMEIYNAIWGQARQRYTDRLRNRAT